MAAYEKAHIDEIASNQWPHWIPIRHHFGIETFGINLWRGQEDGTVIPEHDHAEHGEPELYYTVDGHATFTIEGEEVDAPTGTCLWISDASATRAATARDPGTLVLALRPARHPQAGARQAASRGRPPPDEGGGPPRGGAPAPGFLEGPEGAPRGARGVPPPRRRAPPAPPPPMLKVLPAPRLAV